MDHRLELPTRASRCVLQRLVVVLVAVVGIVVMHGLVDHGTSQPVLVSAVATAPAAHSHHAGHVASTRDVAPSAPSRHEPDGSGVLALCIALLTAVVTLGVGSLRLMRRRRPASLHRVGHGFARPGWTHGLSPPDLTVLCIQRC